MRMVLVQKLIRIHAFYHESMNVRASRRDEMHPRFVSSRRNAHFFFTSDDSHTLSRPPMRISAEVSGLRYILIRRRWLTGLIKKQAFYNESVNVRASRLDEMHPRSVSSRQNDHFFFASDDVHTLPRPQRITAEVCELIFR